MTIHRFLFSTILLTAAWGLSAQTLHMTTGGKKDKIGYADENGEIVIKCKYQIAEEFHDGIAMVSDDGEHYGFINEQGKEVLPIKYDEICPAEHGVRRIRRDDDWGLISDRAELLVKAEYTYISHFNCYGKAWVMKGGKLNKEGQYEDGKYGIINLRGEFLIPADYKWLLEFGSTRYDWKSEYNNFNEQLDQTGKVLSFTMTRSPKDTLETDCRYVGYTSEGKKLKNQEAGLLDDHGKVLLKEGVYTRIYEPANNMMAFYNLDGKKMSTGYMELGNKRVVIIKNGKLKVKKYSSFWELFADSTYVTPFHGEVGLVRVGTHHDYFVDRNGKQVGPAYHDAIWNEDRNHKGLWICNDGKTYSLVDADGKTLVPLGVYSLIGGYDTKDATDLFVARKPNNLCGAIDRAGNEVIPFEYENVYRSRYGYFVVKKNGKFGMVNAKNQIIVEPIYEGLAFNKSANPHCIWVQKNDKQYYCYDLATRQIVSDGYYDVSLQGDGRYAVCVLSNEELAEHRQHSLAEFYPSDYPLADRKQLCVMCNEQGEEIFVAPFPQEPWLIQKILAAVEKNNGQPISYSRAKSVILEANMMFRHYTFGGGKISENEWDF